MKKEDNQFSLDGIDKAILRVLMENARTPVQEIARQLDLSGTAVHQRLKKLEDANLISGSYLKLNPASLGYSTTAYIGVYLDKAMRNPEAVAQLKKIKEGAKFAQSLNLYLAAGHGLNMKNITKIAAIKEIKEFNIGHSIIGEAIFSGLYDSVNKIYAKINK